MRLSRMPLVRCLGRVSTTRRLVHNLIRATAVANTPTGARGTLNRPPIPEFVRNRKWLSTTISKPNETAATADPSIDASGGEKFEFQAETKSLLEIVAKSLYSDQEVTPPTA